MNFSTELDRFLTMPPEDGFELYVEQVCAKYEDRVTENWWDSDIEIRWLEKLFAKQYYPEDAAKIISRAYLIYKINPEYDN
jgi:hypothetical protein